MATLLSVNIRTLLTSCEKLAEDETNFWRLRKFIKSLDKMITELANMDDYSSSKYIEGYKERLQVLKVKSNYNEPAEPHRLIKKETIITDITDISDDALKEMRQLENSNQHAELRRELLNGSDGLRQRRIEDQTTMSNSNMNEAVKYYSTTQAKITEHMLSLTRNLKEQTETANRIIKRDTETVSRSTGMAERNTDSLNKEADKLEQYSRNAYKCWMWLMIAFVIIVFLGMVLFMKIMKKKS